MAGVAAAMFTWTMLGMEKVVVSILFKSALQQSNVCKVKKAANTANTSSTSMLNIAIAQRITA
jgi:hypothetical protein